METLNQTLEGCGSFNSSLCIVCALECWYRVVQCGHFWFGMVVCVAAVSLVKKRCQGEVTVRLECALFGGHSCKPLCVQYLYAVCVDVYFSSLCSLLQQPADG